MRKHLNKLLVATCLLSLSSISHALPSFARQTGEACSACHIGGYGPQLTPHGVQFKIGGYTDSDGKSGKVPLSVMMVEGFTHTKKDAPDGSIDHFSNNNNWSMQEVSLFLAGGINDHVGGFAQTTWNDGDKKVNLDNVDLRLVNKTSVADKDWVYGLSLNNNPSVQDPFNTMPGWRFPFTSTEHGQEYVASPLLDGGMEMAVMGVSAYSFFNNMLYAEVGGYKSLSPSMLKKLNVEGPGKLSGVAPYWRLALFQDMKKQAFNVGIFGMEAKLQPDYLSSGPKDKYRDVGIDASYQFLGTREHIWTVNGSYIHERMTLDYSAPDNRRGNLNRYDVNTSYYYQNTYGVSAGLFGVNGGKNTDFYDPASTVTGSPNTRGYILQADYTPWGKDDSWGSPWANLRLGLQYTGYTKFNGSKNNYDGTGRDAKDNNTLFAFAWLSF
jgi:hypothetical protein